MPYTLITCKDVEETLLKSANWRAPGIDGIHNFWLKRLNVLHLHIARIFNSFIESPSLTPHFFTEGITYLLPKSSNTSDPSQYRPITCLPTLYKLLSGILCTKIYNHLSEHNIMTANAKNN